MKWLLVLLIPATAVAGKHSMHWARGETIHGRGHDDARVEVTFATDTKFAVTDSGSRRERDRDVITTWVNTWTGTYKIDADTLRAELTLTDRKCNKTRSSSAAAAKAQPCDPIDRVIKLHCVFYETELETLPGGPRQVEMLWNCNSENKLGNTPLPWVFGGKPECIEAVAGRDGTVYRRC